MNEAEWDAHWAALNEHQEQVRPTLEAFRARHGFEWVNPSALGRYPRLRIHRSSPIRVFIELSMGPDPRGNRIDVFTPDAPYEMSGGAYLYSHDERGDGLRIQRVFSWFERRPFHLVPQTLETELDAVLQILNGWNEAYLRRTGVVVRFDRPLRPDEMH